MQHYTKFCNGFNKAMEQGAKVYVIRDEYKTLCTTARQAKNEIYDTEQCTLSIVFKDGFTSGIVFVDETPSDWGEKAEMIFDEYLDCEFE